MKIENYFSIRRGHNIYFKNYFFSKNYFFEEKISKNMHILENKDLANRELLGLRFGAHIWENLFGGHIFVWRAHAGEDR